MSDAQRSLAEAVARLMSVDSLVAWRSPDGALRESAEIEPRGLLSGAFNPLHAGHRELLEVAARQLGGDLCYELSIRNADKQPLALEDVQRRWGQFDGAWLAVTAAATFVEKSRLFPGRVFVVGVDTAERILQTRFYADSVRAGCGAGGDRGPGVFVSGGGACRRGDAAGWRYAGAAPGVPPAVRAASTGDFSQGHQLHRLARRRPPTPIVNDAP